MRWNPLFLTSEPSLVLVRSSRRQVGLAECARAELEPARDVLDAMDRVNPKLCGLEGEIGRIVPGAFADLVVTDIDPLENLAALADPDKALSAIISNGQPIRNNFAS